MQRGQLSPVLARPAPRCALVRTFLQQREGRSFSRHFKMTKRGADNDLENEDNGKLVAEVAVGSVTIPIFFSPTRVNVSSSASPPDVPAMARGKPNIRLTRAARKAPADEVGQVIYDAATDGTDRLRCFGRGGCWQFRSGEAANVRAGLCQFHEGAVPAAGVIRRWPAAHLGSRLSSLAFT